MATGPSLPEIKSAKIIHLSELNSWKEDEVHGNAVRVLGRVISTNILANRIVIEYHRSKLDIDIKLLGNHGQFHANGLFQFIGELERENDQFILRARIVRDMTGLNVDLYDRCLKIRREFEEKVLNMDTSKSDGKGDASSANVNVTTTNSAENN